MARSMNRLQILGYAGSDAEIRQTQGGNTLASFAIATTHSWLAEGARQEATTWHRCVAWNDRQGDRRQLATQAEQLIRKGTRVLVEGRLEATSWQDRDGATHQGWQVIVSNFIICSDRRGGDDDAEG